MKPAKDKDYWFRVGLGLAMAVGIGALLVWGLGNPGAWLRAFNRTDNMIVQDQLYRLAEAEKKHLAERGRLAGDWSALAEYGFQPAEGVLMRVTVVALDWDGVRLNMFQAQANKVHGREAFCVSSLEKEVAACPPAAGLLDPQYALAIASERPLRLSGPPFLVFAVKIPGREN